MSKSISEIKIEFEQAGELYISTEDGSVGTKGNVMDAIRENSKISEEAAGTCSGERTPRGNENIREKICGL